MTEQPKAAPVKEWYRVIVTGDRAWRIDERAILIVRKLLKGHPGLIIVHTGEVGKGVNDSFAAACRIEKAAQDVRRSNAEMIESGASLCLAFHRFLPNSKGTRDCVDRALKAGIPVWLLDKEDGEPRKLHRDHWSSVSHKRWGPAKASDPDGIVIDR